MAKNKFKIGDMVIGNAKASQTYVITRQGWIGKVVDVYPNGEILVKARDREMCVGFAVHSKYFDLYKPKKIDSDDPNVLRGKANSSKRILIEVSKEDPTVIKAKYIRGKEYSNEEAYATCSKHDIFDFKTGAKIAFDRIMDVIDGIDGEEKHEEPEKLLNCRFVVTSGAGSGSGPLREGLLNNGYIYTVRRDLEWYLGSYEDHERMKELGIAPDKDDSLYRTVYNKKHQITFKNIKGEIKG